MQKNTLRNFGIQPSSSGFKLRKTFDIFERAETKPGLIKGAETNCSKPLAECLQIKKCDEPICGSMAAVLTGTFQVFTFDRHIWIIYTLYIWRKTVLNVQYERSNSEFGYKLLTMSFIKVHLLYTLLNFTLNDDSICKVQAFWQAHFDRNTAPTGTNRDCGGLMWMIIINS